MDDQHPHGVTTVGACVYDGCTATLVPRTQWYRLGRKARDELMAAGYARTQARQLCSTHYEAARNAGTLADYERLLRPAADLLEDFETIRDTLPRDASRAERLRRAGARLRITPEALDLALRRHGVAA